MQAWRVYQEAYESFTPIEKHHDSINSISFLHFFLLQRITHSGQWTLDGSTTGLKTWHTMADTGTYNGWYTAISLSREYQILDETQHRNNRDNREKHNRSPTNRHALNECQSSPEDLQNMQMSYSI